MFVASALEWANSNAPAITALATICLVLITAVYVVVTYLLVREQRLQGHSPDVSFEWADPETRSLDLRLRNVGNGTATQLTILRGPGSGVPVDEGKLGVRRTLLPGEDLVWKIRPPEGVDRFEGGDLPLTMSYFSSDRTKVLFEVLSIELVEDGHQIWPVLTGSGARWWTKRAVRRLTSKSLKWWKRPQFAWKTKNFRLSFLLLSDDVRSALGGELIEIARSLKAVSDQAQNVRRHI
jgi:hypothetical protein